MAASSSIAEVGFVILLICTAATVYSQSTTTPVPTTTTTAAPTTTTTAIPTEDPTTVPENTGR